MSLHHAESIRAFDFLTRRERKAFEELPLNPIAAIELRMEQLDFDRRDLEPYIGTRARVSEILNGKRDLSLAMVRNLHAHLAIPLAHLLAETPRP